MIIERGERATLGSLKRRPPNAGAALPRRKRRRDLLDEPFPLELLGEVSVPESPYELLFGMPSVSLPSPPRSPSPPVTEEARPSPVLRSSRGRARALPSRFNDSVLLDPWKKEKESERERDRKSKKKYVDHDYDDDEGMDKDPDYDVILPDVLSVRDEEERYRACRNFGKRKFVAGINGSNKVAASLPLHSAKNGVCVVKRKRSLCVQVEDVREVKFVYGDVVWGKKGKKHAAWPGIVIDPMQYAPEAIRVPRVPGALCLMFFGYSEVGNERVFSWVQLEGIFPFLDNVDRFQGQTELFGRKPSGLRLAIEEAFLAERGFLGGKFDSTSTFGQPARCDYSVRGGEETSCSDHDENSHSHIQNGKFGLHCERCASSLDKNESAGEQLVCRNCTKVLKLGKRCVICKKGRHRVGTTRWVSCRGCKAFVHAECDKRLSKFKDVRNISYSCPNCRSLTANSSKMDSQARSQHPSNSKLLVRCYDMEGTYVPDHELISCHCVPCKRQMFTFTEWERHCGCKSKNWRSTIIQFFLLLRHRSHSRLRSPIGFGLRPGPDRIQRMPFQRATSFSAMGVADETKTIFFDLKRKKAHRYVIFRIDDKEKEVIVEKQGAPWENYDDFTAALPTDDCRFAVYDYDFVTEDNCQKSKIFFIAWSPSISRIRAKMLYAMSKERLRYELDGVHYEIQATEPSEMDLQVLMDRAN